MTARAVIDAVMAEVALDILDITYAVGAAEVATRGAAPRVEWLPVGGDFQGPQQSGANPRALQNRWVRYEARCWGSGHDATEAILEAVVRALHLTLTIGGYRVQGEEWARPGANDTGEVVTLTCALGLPVLDRVQPTAGAPNPDLIVSGGFS